MFETNICVVGNVLTAPEWRRTSASGRLVTTFKVAAATRRLDRTTGAWVDGNGLRVRVSCWRDLASGVASSIMVGDPVVVYGQIYTRDWVDSEGVKRTLYEMEALAVGHNLARGRARFARNKPVSASEVEGDPTQPVRLGGEATELAKELPVGLDPSDPLRRLDDSAFDESVRFDDPLTSLNGDEQAAFGEGLAGGAGLNGDEPAAFGEGLAGGPWRFPGAEPLGGLLATDLTDAGDAEDADDTEGDEDAEDEESADDAEAVEHRPEDDDGTDGEETPKDAAKARRRRRTPAGV
jgi:single-strand DNA-binding protein